MFHLDWIICMLQILNADISSKPSMLYRNFDFSSEKNKIFFCLSRPSILSRCLTLFKISMNGEQTKIGLRILEWSFLWVEGRYVLTHKKHCAPRLSWSLLGKTLFWINFYHKWDQLKVLIKWDSHKFKTKFYTTKLTKNADYFYNSNTSWFFKTSMLTKWVYSWSSWPLK